MFSVILGKKSMIYIAVFLLLAMGISGAIYFSQKSELADTEPASHFQVIIDAGHGGVDGGAVGYNGTIEKEINLKIALIVRDILLLSGTDVVMTRDEDLSIHDEDAKTIRQKKQSDLTNRLDIIEENTNSITISIHQNSHGRTSKGLQMYYSPNNSASIALAQTIQNVFLENINNENEREIKAAGSNLFLMYNATSPAVLVECGFLSNPDEESMLNTEEYQSKMAYVICMAVLQYRKDNNI